MDYYNHMNQDMWWMSENSEQSHYTNYSYDDGFYSNECYEDDQYESYDNGYYVSYDNDCGWTDNSAQNHYFESPYSSETQESLDESSGSNMWEQMRDMQEDNSKRLLTIQKKLDELMEQLNQPPPPENLSDTTQVEEVSSLSSDELCDNKVHKPTPPEVEMVVEGYESLHDKDSERFLEVKEVVTGLENCNENLHDLETTKVGEGFVESNTTPDPMDLKAHENQPLVVTQSKRPICFKQPYVFIDRPLLATIYTQNSCRDCMIDVTFGDQKVSLLLFEPTDDPLISGDLVVINTIDDHVYEHTANMLSDTSHKLETCLSCFRSKGLECQIMKRKLWRNKHDTIYAHKSKTKVLHSIKSRSKNFIRRKILWFHKTRFKRYHGRHKVRRFGFYKVNESMPFDPGGSRFAYDPP